MKNIVSVGMICLLSLSLSLAISSSAMAQVDPGSTSKITIQYLLDEPAIQRGAEILTSPDGSMEIYDSLTIGGLHNRIAAGEPLLPFRTARILIPYGEEVSEVKVIPGNEKYLGRVSIRPGQSSVPIGFTRNCTTCHPEDNWTNAPELALRNEEVYGSDSPYPAEPYSILGVQKKHGYDILYINLYPIRYIPTTGDAYSYGAFDIEVTTAPDQTLDQGIFRGLAEDREEVMAIVDNPEKATTYAPDLAPTGKSLLLDGDYDYVIITNQFMKEAPRPYNFQALADWKSERGLKVAIVTVEEIYAAYKYTYHRDEQEMIRNFIKDAYMNNGIRFVLLGGDGDGARIGGETWDAVVPARGLWAWAYEPDPSCCCPPVEGATLVSDLYYACLEGSFDGNDNGLYGEPTDGVNLHADVYVGRAPVDNYEELSNFVRKTIAYESTRPDDPYLTAIWLIGEYMEPMLLLGTNVSEMEDHAPEKLACGGWGGDYKDQIKGVFPAAFNIWTLYDRDYPGGDCNCDQNDWPRSLLEEMINADMIHAINHIGTSNFCDIVAYVMKMGYNHADALNNSKYFFGYSQAGYAASFDNRDPEGVYLPHDCVIEHFVTATAGAFAFIGNTRYGLIDLDSVNDSPSQKFDKAFWEEMFGSSYTNDNRSLGLVNQLSKEAFISDVLGGDENMRYCYYEITLLGDPETPFLVPAAAPVAAETPAPEVATPALAAAPEAAEEKNDSIRKVPPIFGEEMRLELFESPMKFEFEGGMSFGSLPSL